MIAIDRLPSPVLVSDRAGKVLQINRSFLDAVGLAAQAVVGQPMERLFTAASRIFLQTHVWPMLLNAAAVHEIKLQLLGPAGGALPVLTNCQANGVDGALQYDWIFFISQERSRFEDELLKSKKLAEQSLHRLRVSEETLQLLLRDKESLIKEVHHRVKNNLQVITSLLRLESGRSDTAAVKAVLSDMQGRIRTMSTLHEMLYRSGTLASLDLGAYIGQIATQTFRSLMPTTSTVRLCTRLASVQVGMEQAAPCGLLVSELMYNSLKHGFPDGRTGELCVELHCPSDQHPRQWCLRVTDTGIGLPADYEQRAEKSLGLQLATGLAQQAGGQLRIDSGRSVGAAFTLSFAVEPLPA